MRATSNRLLATASIIALGFGTAGVGQAADLAGAAPIIPQEMSKPGRTISGTVGIYGAYMDLEEGGEEEGGSRQFEANPWAIGGDARVDIPFNDYVSLQLDQYGEGLFGDLETSENYTGGYLTGAHLTYREMDRYLLGAFAGVGKVHFASTSDDAYTQWLVGVEGQAYFGNTTLFGQGGYSDVDSNDSTSQNSLAEAWFLRGVARHYMNGGDTKLEGELGWAHGVNDNVGGGNGTDSVDAIWWGAEIEHAVWSFGYDGFVSLFGRYEGYYYDEDNQSGGDETTNHVFILGARFDLNQENPLMRERNGVAVNLPNMTRINGLARTVELPGL